MTHHGRHRAAGSAIGRFLHLVATAFRSRAPKAAAPERPHHPPKN